MSEGRLQITILGCGTSSGVPRLGPNWGACDPANPKNRRRRAAILVERITDAGRTVVLIDTGPDLREQMLSAAVSHLDAVLITHAHADHIHGIDDLRGFYLRSHTPVNVYADRATSDRLMGAFRYCFVPSAKSSYPAVAALNTLTPDQDLIIEGAGGTIHVTPFCQQHGTITSLGFRFGSFAYSSDVSDFDDAAQRQLKGIEVWVLDALRHAPHPSHFCVDEALHWVHKIKPKKTYFTHMDNSMDYEGEMAKLPDGVELAYDGLTFDVAGG